MEHALSDDSVGPVDRPCTTGSQTFVDMVREHWMAVYRLLYSLTGSTHSTEDLTQETFLRAISRYDTFQPGTQLRPWLMRIAANAFFDEQRKRKRVKMESLKQEPIG